MPDERIRCPECKAIDHWHEDWCTAPRQTPHVGVKSEMLTFSQIEPRTQFVIVGMEDVLWQKEANGSITAIQPTGYEYSIPPDLEVALIEKAST